MAYITYFIISPCWRLARSLLYEWMGVALGTSDDVVVTALVDRRWRAVDEGWSGVKHNWALPPLRGETAREGKTGVERDIETAASAHSSSEDKLLAKQTGEMGGCGWHQQNAHWLSFTMLFFILEVKKALIRISREDKIHANWLKQSCRNLSCEVYRFMI